MEKQSTWKQVGVIGVDAGLCWIGDPCYFLQGPPPKEIGRDQSEFCSNLEIKEDKADSRAIQFNHDSGHAGLGVCVGTGYGDGEYPVMARFEGGRVMEINVRFDRIDDLAEDEE